ncbi:MAG: hypothetical protein IPO78_01510 [Saprospiraceae bacterium]|nr:hypothetical protein [Saprospiraceae bacterium]MBK8485450.1 hypothetical protein [Saprospiraceae bacterium]MBK9222678.1 hypothetical protein [Saprospiraceae bacterium]MBK9720277.1 hypothetical protein [Saprospiraceae bacterium]MBK9727272.1 hypothetical protein [Saprospiraceae bacterium]
MKNPFFLFFIFLILGACVSNKKHKSLMADYRKLQTEMDDSQRAITKKELENYNLERKLVECGYKSNYGDTKIEDLKTQLDVTQKTNIMLKEMIEQSLGSFKTHVVYLQKALDEINEKDQQINVLSSALQKKDSVNVILVKRVKNSITDKRFKKSLEKIGITF